MSVENFGWTSRCSFCLYSIFLPGSTARAPHASRRNFFTRYSGFEHGREERNTTKNETRHSSERGRLAGVVNERPHEDNNTITPEKAEVSFQASKREPLRLLEVKLSTVTERTYSHLFQEK